MSLDTADDFDLDASTEAIEIPRRPKRSLHGITEAGPGLLPLKAGEQYRFTFDMNACIGCHSCEVACAEQNSLPVEVAWRRVGEIEGGEFPHTKRFNLSMACNHCLEPTCLEGCPTGAYIKLANGVVQHQADECIGCQYCTWNCPYSVPVFHAARKIVTKCDMCLPRLESGSTSACVEACPTHAIGIEIVDVAIWRADHTAADAPNLPSSDITISTTRIVLPTELPSETFAASDHDLRPEHPHWPLVVVTLLHQLAVGTMGSLIVVGVDRSRALVAFALAVLTLPVALLHLSRPAHAWKALRGLRRSWLSREVLAFALFACFSAIPIAVESRVAAAIAFAIGTVGVYASSRLYVVKGRPAWDTPLTVVAFLTAVAAMGPLLAMAIGDPAASLRAIGAAAVAVQLVVLLANQLRLRAGPGLEWRGSHRLMTQRFAKTLAIRVFTAIAGAALVVTGTAWLGLVLVGSGELLGRYLFFVTVVPMNMPGSFRSRRFR